MYILYSVYFTLYVDIYTVYFMYNMNMLLYNFFSNACTHPHDLDKIDLKCSWIREGVISPCTPTYLHLWTYPVPIRSKLYSVYLIIYVHVYKYYNRLPTIIKNINHYACDRLRWRRYYIIIVLLLIGTL